MAVRKEKIKKVWKNRNLINLITFPNFLGGLDRDLEFSKPFSPFYDFPLNEEYYRTFKGLKTRKEMAALKSRNGNTNKSGEIVSEAITEEMNISEAADGSENKAAFIRTSLDSTDDGYNSSGTSVSRENTFEEDQYHAHHQSIQNKVDPKAKNVDKLVLGLVGSTASAPVFAMFGKESRFDSDKEIVVKEEDCSRANSSATNPPDEEEEPDVEQFLASYEESAGQIVQTRESSGRVAGVGAIPFHLHPGRDLDEPHYSGTAAEDSKVQTEDDILVNEELNHSLMIHRETSLLINKEMELDTNDKDDLKTSLVKKEIDEVDVEVYLRPESCDGQLLLFYLKERNIPHTVKPLSVSDMTQQWFLTLSAEGLDPVMTFNHQDVVIESLKIMDFLERKLPVDIYPMAIPCSTSTRAYQKYLFYCSLLHTIPMDGIKLRTEAEEANIDDISQLVVRLKGIFFS